MRPRPAALTAAVLALTLAGAEPSASADDALSPAQRLAELHKESAALEKRLTFVTSQYSREIVPSGISEAERRFSEAEIRFLLKDYGAAAVFLYDVVDNPAFQASPRYVDALYYLGESLYQQKSYLPSRRYFSVLLRTGAGRYTQDALLRLIEISGRTGDFSGVDRYVSRLMTSGSRLRPEVLYVYGKFLFERKDLPRAQRISRAMQVFQRVPPSSSFAVASRYFIGVLEVEQGHLDNALQAFESVVAQPARTKHDAEVQDLGWMAVGRVYYSEDKYEKALDAYQHIGRHSDQFYESLYEIAWTYVKKGDYENAQRACEILLVGASDSPLAPKARILIGHLYAKNKKYATAVKTYDKVINTYAPVRDEIDALLALHDDPVRYFNELIARQGSSFDVQSILPPVAVKWASTETDVKKALSIVTTVEKGKKGVADGQQIADRILASLDAGTLEPFPTLAEGYRRGDEIQNAVLRLQSDLAGLESEIVNNKAPGDLQAQLVTARTMRQQLERQLKTLPTTKEAAAARTKARLARVDEMEKAAYRLQVAADSLDAQLVAMGKYLRDTAATSHRSEAANQDFAKRLDRWGAVVAELHTEAKQLLDKLTELKDGVQSGTIGADETDLRTAYESALAREHAVAEKIRATMGGTDADQLRDIDGLRAEAKTMLERDRKLLTNIQARAQRRRDGIRRQVLLERQRLGTYGGQVDGVMGDTKNLVGRIALNSFKKVQKQFYNLILKADVGIIDVAWQKKTDKSKQIQKLAKEKDRQLKLLDRDFAEVLKEDK